MNEFTLDLSVGPGNPLYEGCQIEETPGNWHLKQQPGDVIILIGRNAEQIVKEKMVEGVEQLTLTGRSAIWVYLVVFHSVVHRFRRIYYDDGKPNGKVLIAAH